MGHSSVIQLSSLFLYLTVQIQIPESTGTPKINLMAKCSSNIFPCTDRTRWAINPSTSTQSSTRSHTVTLLRPKQDFGPLTRGTCSCSIPGLKGWIFHQHPHFTSSVTSRSPRLVLTKEWVRGTYS